MRLLQRLFGTATRDPAPDFRAAYERYRSACVRGDTRAQHDAWTALREARTQQLRAETGAAPGRVREARLGARAAP